jgi:hypothetical protein
MEGGADLFFSHNDANRFFERCVESESPARGMSVVLHAQSRPVNIARMDVAEATEVIGYVPQDTWPGGLPFPVA